MEEQSVALEDHRSALKAHYTALMKELNPDSFIDKLAPFLGEHHTALIKDKITRRDKTTELLRILDLGPAEHFQSFCTVIAGQYPAIFKLLTGKAPTSEEEDFIIQDFIKELKSSIIAIGNRPDNEIDKPIDLDTQFVNLRLAETSNRRRRHETVGDGGYPVVKKNRKKVIPHDRASDNALPDDYQNHVQKGNGRNVNIVDILDSKPFSSYTLSRILTCTTLIKGRAGVGKSTLMQYIMRLWAKGLWGKQYSVVFLLNLRRLAYIERDMTITQLLGLYAEYVPLSPNHTVPSIEWLEQHQEKVLIMTDGIDEIPDLLPLIRRTPKLNAAQEKATPLEWCVNLMLKRILVHSDSLLISRPFIGLEQLAHNKAIEVLGLTPERVMLFVERNVSKAKVSIIQDALKRDILLLSVCSITFYCAAVCKILEMDSTINTNNLITYSRITAYIITRLAARNASDEAITGVLSDELTKCLPDLAALAYKGLKCMENGIRRLVFDDKDLNDVSFSCATLKMARKTGLFTYIDVKDPLSVNHEVSLQAQFAHLSIQEFLGMAKMLVSDVEAIVKNLQETAGSGRFNMSEILTFGLAFDTSNRYIGGIKQCISKKDVKRNGLQDTTAEKVLQDAFEDLCAKASNDKYAALQAVQSAYESQNPTLAKRLSGCLLSDGWLPMHHMQMTAVDMKALTFVLGYSQIETLNLGYIHIDDASAKEIQMFLAKCRSLKSLTLLGTTMSGVGARYISAGIKQSTCLQHVKLGQFDIPNEAIQYFAEAVEASTALEYFELTGIRLDSDGMKHMSKAVNSVTHLKHLVLTGNSLSNEGVKILSEGIQSSTCLKILEVNHNGLTSEKIKSLSDGIKCANSIEYLALKGNENGIDSGINYLADALGAAITLRHLEIWNSGITDSGVEQIAEGIRSGSKLQHLSLWDLQLTYKGIQPLCQAIQHSPNLQHLELRCMALDDQSVKCLVDTIESGTGLCCLDLRDSKCSPEGQTRIENASMLAIGSSLNILFSP